MDEFSKMDLITKNPDLLKEHISIVNQVVDLVDERLALESIASEVAVSPY